MAIIAHFEGNNPIKRKVEVYNDSHGKFLAIIAFDLRVFGVDAPRIIKFSLSGKKASPSAKKISGSGGMATAWGILGERKRKMYPEEDGKRERRSECHSRQALHRWQRKWQFLKLKLGGRKVEKFLPG